MLPNPYVVPMACFTLELSVVTTDFALTSEGLEFDASNKRECVVLSFWIGGISLNIISSFTYLPAKFVIFTFL